MMKAGAIEAQPERVGHGVAAEQHQFGAVASRHLAAIHQNAESGTGASSSTCNIQDAREAAPGGPQSAAASGKASAAAPRQSKT